MRLCHRTDDALAACPYEDEVIKEAGNIKQA